MNMTLHTRHRRFLSADRRTGIQVPPEVARGCSQRFSQSWRDQQQDEDERLLTIETIMKAVIYGVFAWCAFGAAIWVVAKVLIWAIGG